MSKNDQPNSLFHPQFVITIILVLGVWLLWQAHLAKKYPQVKSKQPAPVVDMNSGSPIDTTNSGGEKVNSTENAKKDYADGVDGISTTAPTAEKITKYKDAQWELEMSTAGMSVKKIKLLKYFDRDGNNIEFKSAMPGGLFSTSILGQTAPIDFDIQKTGDREYTGTAELAGMKISKVMRIDSDKYLIHNDFLIENVSNLFSGVTVKFSDVVVKNESTSFLTPSFEHQEFFVDHEGEISRIQVQPDSSVSENYAFAKIVGFGTQYFGVAVFDKSDIKPEFSARLFVDEDADKKTVSVGALTYKGLSTNKTFRLQYESFAGPKSYDLLKSISLEMTALINFGFFTSIAKGIFWLMQMIHNVMGNWGVAIIFLTIVVRIVVLPFNLIGYKQMKAMAKIQPQMKALREKYKNDAQKMNQEVLALMKSAKANPLGGCLPMLLQIPVFFALYQVIGQSIELYQAPFALWIHDLSLKDPYYVLPALMGITMYIQQKITPSTMEPAQQKIMNFMPLIFTFFMISLPSGVTLYIFISSVFGVLQQFYFMKEKKLETATA